MANEPREWESTPEGWARWLAELATKVVHQKQRENRAVIHAGTWDFAEEFELPIQLLIAETEFSLLNKYARKEQPSFGTEAMKKMLEINRLRFEIGQREHPDK
jgi:hypothetical protein